MSLFLPRTSLALLLLAPVACGDDIPSSDGGSTGDGGSTTGADGTSTTDPVADEGSTAAPATSDSGGQESTDETGFDPADPVCGNGFVEEDEECDDGNADDADACSNACQIPCGLQWDQLVLGPTLDSVIEGLGVARDAGDQVIISGLLREVTVEMDGTTTVGEDTVLVQSHMSEGAGMVWEQVLDDPEGDVNFAGVAVDAAGEIYVAATVDAADGGRAIRAYRLAAADGAVTWVHDFDGAFAGEDELAFGIAVGPDGQPVVSGQVRAGDGDDDVWVRKLDAADGSEVWTETYSGLGSGGFSTDDGGPIAIGDDGSIYVLARIYVDFQTAPGTLLRFGPDGGAPTWTFAPTPAGADQTFNPETVTVASDGGPVMAVSRVDGADFNFWVYKLDAAGQEQWLLEREDFEIEGQGSDWILEDISTNDEELIVLGRYRNDDGFDGQSWSEPWISRLDGDANLRCQVLHQGDVNGLLPPSLFGYGVATGSAGNALVAGELASEDESGLWFGSFRN
ncbi:MAG: DUF4215 domain-containing protein [Myxococcota bacterium]